jgi:nitroreductase
MPDFFDVVLSQRAHRALLPDPISDEVVERLLEAAVHAPSSENSQPWEFVVVRDAATRRAVGEVAARIWALVPQDAVREKLGDRLFAAVDRWTSGGLAAAPVIVVVCGDASSMDEGTLAASIYPAAQNLALAAHAMGLGSLFATLPTLMPGELSGLLGLPDHLKPMAVIPIGKPAKQLRAPRRTPAREKAHRDRYGVRW